MYARRRPRLCTGGLPHIEAAHAHARACRRPSTHCTRTRNTPQVALDPEAVAEARRRAQEEAAAAVAAGASGLQPDDTLEGYNEDEVDKLQAAQPSGQPGAGGGEGNNFVGMLKS